jgi:hypothetical protein
MHFAATGIPTHTALPRLKEEVRPAERLARAQVPNDATRWQTVIPIIEELKAKARKLGLWNLFLSKAHYPEHGVPLTNLEVRPPRSLVPLLFAAHIPVFAVCGHGRNHGTVWAHGLRGDKLLRTGYWQHG